MTYAVIGLMGLGAAAWVVRCCLLWHFRRKVASLSAESPADATPPLPSVTIVVPAKDEEANIAACLGSLLAQDYGDFEVVAVDDRSSDRTAEIIGAFATRHPNLAVIRNSDLPAGWTGKCHALSLGAAAARGDWLLFTDADTVHAAGALQAAMTFATSRRLDLLTLLPAMATRGLCEGALQPCLGALFLSLFSPSLVNGSLGALPFANGQYILVRRAAYERLGGHAAVRGAFLEDLALARLASTAQWPSRGPGRRMRLEVAYGGAVLRTRMYRGMRCLWRGWSRIFYGSGRSVPALLLTLALSLVTTVLPTAVAVWSAAGACNAPAPWNAAPPLLKSEISDLRFQDATMPRDATMPLLKSEISDLRFQDARVLTALALLNVAMMAVCMGAFYRLAHCPLRFLPFHPLATVVALAVLANAVRLRCFGKRLTWRGTTYRGLSGRCACCAASAPAAPADPATVAQG